MQRKCNGSVDRGRPLTKWTDDLIKDVGSRWMQEAQNKVQEGAMPTSGRLSTENMMMMMIVTNYVVVGYSFYTFLYILTEISITILGL